MVKNMATWDRGLRLIITVAIVVLWVMGKITGGWLIAALIIGAIFLVTSLIGFCPLYRLFGKTFGTKRQAPPVTPQNPPTIPPQM